MRRTMPEVTLNTGRSFSADPTVSILDAAHHAGVALEYSCRTGRCRVCKAPLLSGETVALRVEESLTDEDRAAGIILTCCRAATGDTVLDIEDLDRLAGVTTRTLPSRIVSLERLSPDILHVVLKTPPATPLTFLAGQYIDTLTQGVRRSYSLANAPRADGVLELLIKRLRGGVLSDYWFERARPDDLLRIEGPFGTFFLREDAQSHIIFLATGTGIAPVRALLQELASVPESARRHRLSVFWGNRHARDFCWDLSGLGLDVTMLRLLTGEDVSWGEQRGYVQDAALSLPFDPARSVVYACGSPTMIEGARAAMLARDLSPRRFYSDAFVRSS